MYCTQKTSVGIVSAKIVRYVVSIIQKRFTEVETMINDIVELLPCKLINNFCGIFI